MSDTLRPLDGVPVRNLPPPATAAPMATPHYIGARRSPTRLVAGILLTAVVVLAFVTVDLRANHKTQVLAITTTVAAGQPLTADDLIPLAVSAENAVPLIAARDLSSVVGRTAAVPLVRGELLAPRLLGPATFPPDGQAILAVDLKPGQTPAGLQPGSAVLALVTAADASRPAAPAASPVSAQASVVSVDATADGSGDLVVSLLMARDDAVTLAGASAGSVSLVLVGAH